MSSQDSSMFIWGKYEVRKPNSLSVTDNSMVQRMSLQHLLYYQSVFRSRISLKKNQTSVLGGPLLCNVSGSREQEVIQAFCRVLSVQSLRIFPPESWERFVCTCARTQQSIDAVFEGDHWDGNNIGTGLGTRNSAKSGIHKSFWLPFRLHLSLF